MPSLRCFDKMKDLAEVADSEKRRRRPPLACVACRRRKVRCDRKRPCQNCVRTRKAASCAYVPDDRLEPWEDTQGVIDGINGSSSERDGVVSAHVGGGSYVSPSITATSSSNPKTTSNFNRETEALHDRVQQLEQQLRQVLDSKRNDTDAASGTKSTQLPLKHSDPSSAARCLGEEYWVIDGPQTAQGQNAGPTEPPETRALLAKSRYLGGSHWMHGLSLVSLFL